MGARPLADPHALRSDPRLGTEVGPPISSGVVELADERLLRRLNGFAVFLGGPANVIMQLAWPEVGHGVLESKVHSGSVLKHPFKRFRTTIGYLGIALTGDDDLRADYREAVNKQHRPVRSGPDSPVKYNAFNRELQLWVASCLYYGLRDILIRTTGPLTPDEEETVLRASARFGTTLQVPEEMWHQDFESFEAYWADGMARVGIDGPVHDYLMQILDMRILPPPLKQLLSRPLMWSNTGFLPPEIRDAMGLEWSDRDERLHAALMRAIGRTMAPIPYRLRMLPIDLMVANIRLRRRLGRPLA